MDWITWKIGKYGDRFTKAHLVLSWASNRVACGLSTVMKHPALAEKTTRRCSECVRLSRPCRLKHSTLKIGRKEPGVQRRDA